MMPDLNALASSLAQTWLGFSVVLAAQLGLVLLLRKPVRAWLGAIACYRLWLLPLLCLPFYLAGPALLAKLASLGDETQTVSDLQLFIDFELLPFDVGTSSTALSASGNPAVDGWLVLALVWGMGTLAFLAWQGRRWLDFSRQVAALAAPLPEPERKHCGAAAHFGAQVPVLSLPGMGSAALFGVFKPTLLLPDTFCRRYDANQRHIILAHEAVHLRRGDNGWNVCALLLLALFWTNPLVLLAWRYYRLDQELSCDALALARCNKEQQKRYARTLLDSLDSLSPHSAQPALSAWDKLGDIKQRSLMIRQHLHTATRPVAMLLSLASLALLGAAVTVIFAELVSPVAQAVEPTPQTQLVRQASRQVIREAEQVAQEIQQVVQEQQQVVQEQVRVAQEAQQEAQAPRRIPQRDMDERTGHILSEAIAFLNQEKFAEAKERLGDLQPSDLTPFERSRYEQLLFNLDIADENYPGARAHIQAAIASDGLNAQEISTLRYHLAQLYMQEEKYAEASAALEEWISSAPTQTSAPYYMLAASYYYQGEFAKALPNAQKAVELGDPPAEGWLTMLASLHIEEKQFAAAERVMAQLVEQFPGKENYRAQLENLKAQNQR